MVKKIECKDFIPGYDIRFCYRTNRCEVGMKYKVTGCDGDFVIPEFVELDCPMAKFLKIDGIEIDKDRCDYLINYNTFEPFCTRRCNPRRIEG